MKLYNTQQGAWEDLPEDQAEAAFRAGTHEISTGEDVPIELADGQIGKVPPGDVQKYLDGGGHFTTQEAWQKSHNELAYGKDVAAPIAEGALRGISFGLSDPAAIGTARLFGGEQAAQATREHLAGEKAAHPILSTAAEVAGSVAPALLSGGASEAATAPSLARSLMGITPAGLAARAGAVAEGALRFPAATNALARVAQVASKSAVFGAVDTALFAGGAQISEDSLGDHESTAQKVLGAMGHGFFAGAVLGGVGGAAIGTGGELLRRAAPKIDRVAADQAWRSMGARKAFATRAERVGGARAVGRELLDSGVIPRSPVQAAGLTGEKLAARIDDAVDAKWQEMKPLLEGGGTVSREDVAEAIDKVIREHEKIAGREGIVDRLKDYRNSLLGKLGGEAPEAAAQVPSRVRRTGPEIAEYLRAHPEATQEFATTGKLPDSVTFRDVEPATKAPTVDELGANNTQFNRDPESYRPEATQAERAKYAGMTPEQAEDFAVSLDRPIDIHAEADGSIHLNDGRHRLAAAETAGAKSILARIRHYDAEGNILRAETRVVSIHGKPGLSAGWKPRVSLEDLMSQRKGLDETLRWQSTAAPPPELAAMRDVRKNLADLEIKAVDDAGSAPGMGDKLKKLRTSFSRLKIAQEATKDAVTRTAHTNRAFSLTDTMTGAAELAGGGLLAAPKAVAAASAHKFLRERGNAITAAALSRLSKVDLLARGAAQADGEIKNAVGTVTGRTKPRARPHRFGELGAEHRPAEERMHEHADQIARTGPMTDEDIDKAVPGLSRQAPATAAQMRSTLAAGTAYLQAQKPQPLSAPSLVDPLAKPRYSELDVQAFLDKVKAVQDPLSTLCDGLESGRLTTDQIVAIGATSPKLLEAVRSALLQELTQPHGPIPMNKLNVVAKLFGGAPDPSFQGPAIMAMQSAFAPPAPPPVPAKSGRTVKANASSKLSETRIEGSP